jgi:ComF family protein
MYNKFMKKFLIDLLDWIYRKKCYFCGSSKECLKMCSSCYDELEHLSFEKNREIFGADVYCAGVYEQNLQKLIRGLKYHQQRDLAYFQAKFMYDYWQKIPDKKDSYQVVPIPLFKTREKNRKYNHMILVAEEFCKLTGYELNVELVKRVKDTKPQYKLNKNQRMENLSNAFIINKNAGLKKQILLIDDICTTGSTFESIILELQKNGMNDIICFATATPVYETGRMVNGKR